MSQNKIRPAGIAAFFIVLLCMPLGHAAMILMEHFLQEAALKCVAFLLGGVGIGIVVLGIFFRNDNLATLCGYIGGLLVWTGWIEFTYVFFARSLNVAPLVENGEVVTKPEYLLLMSSVGFWAVVSLFYILKLRSGCHFYLWIQKRLRINPDIDNQPPNGNKSVTTFMETIMLLWSCYLLLMFAYDESLLGTNHPVTIFIAVGCLIWSLWLVVRLVRINALGRAIRYALPTVIIFWTFVEVMGRVGWLKEVWIEPMRYKSVMVSMLLALVLFVVGGIMIRKRK